MISEKVLRRLAEPSSPLHSDYLAYRNQEIGWDELVARLPHVALIGDSVCTGVYMSSIWSTFWRARTCRGNNWFLDTNPAPAGIQSISKRLEEFTPFVAIECAGIGALVDHEGERQNLFRRILRTRNSSEPCHFRWIAAICSAGAIESNSPVTKRTRAGSHRGTQCNGELS